MILNSCCLAEKLQDVKKNVFLFLAGGKINRLGQLAPGGEDNQGGGQDIPGYLAPRGASCPGGQDKLLHRRFDFHETWYVASGTPAHHSLFK